MRKCKVCKKEKHLNRFPVASIHKGKTYRKYTCYNCVSIRTRETHWKRRGIVASWELFLERLEVQGGKCAICGKKVLPYQEGRKNTNSACLDHDHKTNKPRGILCETCNRAIGLLKDSPKVIENAVAYLNKWKPKGEK